MKKLCVIIILTIVLLSTSTQAKEKCKNVSLLHFKYLAAQEGYFLFLTGKHRNKNRILQTYLRDDGDFILVESDELGCIVSATRGIYLAGVKGRIA